MDGTPAPGRGFTRLDASILFAATALGLAMSKEVFGLYTCTMFDEGRHNPHGFRLWGYAVVPLFVALSIALIPLRFLRPRPRAVRLARCPGFLPPCVVALLTLGAVINVVAWFIVNRRAWGVQPRLFWLGNVWDSLPSHLVFLANSAGFPVAAAWLALRLCRWWRPERSWIDRAGRALGWYWIAMFIVQSYYGLAS